MIRILLAAVAGLVALVLALPAALLVLPFWIVRRCTAWVVDRRMPHVVTGDPFIRFHRLVGWTPRPDLDAHALDLNEDLFHFTTDSEGWRGGTTLEEADVVVFGDSFAFGYAVSDDDFFGHLDPSFPIKAIGAPGYNMVQALLWMRELASRIRGKTIVWFVYPPNDLEDNIRPSMLEYRTPFVKEGADGEWELETGHLSEEPWPFPSRKRHFENYVDICAETDLTRRVFGACRHLIREAHELCRSIDARLVVTTVPELSPLALQQMERARSESPEGERYDPSLPDRRFGQICGELDVPFVPLSEELGSEDYLRHDVHWNADGHRKVHRVLRRIWREGGAVEVPSDVPFEAAETAATVGT